MANDSKLHCRLPYSRNLFVSSVLVNDIPVPHEVEKNRYFYNWINVRLICIISVVTEI